MTRTSIPFGKPMLSPEAIESVIKVLNGHTLVHGPFTQSFEEMFARRVGVEHAVSVSSCTAGLHLSLVVNDVHRGDEVIVPAMTHVATAHAVEYCGARPIFVDVEADTGNIDPKNIRGALSGRTRAIMVVHYLGLPCAMGEIADIAEGSDIFVIEDCALAVDATYDGQKVGGLGLTGCFSFYPIKHITTIEGGMVTTNDRSIAEAVRKFRAFGYDKSLGERSKPGIYDVTAPGYNYRMNEVEAAVGLSQLSHLDQFQIARAENYKDLKEILDDVQELTIFEASKDKSVSSHYCLNAILPRDGRINRDEVVAELNHAGIGTSVHYPKAVPLTAFYAEKYGHLTGQFPVAEWLAKQTISLPVGPHLNPGDARKIGLTLKEVLYKISPQSISIPKRDRKI